MQGCKQFEPRLFYQLSLEKLLPKEHLVRKLAETLDFSWVRSATARYYSHTGKPSIDPVVVTKLLLLGFLYNLDSERQLLREVQVNLAYRWYLGYDLDEEIPDHSILSKARRRLGVEFFEKLFEYILTGCQQAGLVKGENVLIDSTMVQANASLDSVTTLRYQPREYWQQLEKTSGPENESDSHQTPSSDDKQNERMGQKRPRAQRTCDKKYSTTDPQASLQHRKGKGAQLAYKTHFLADEQSGIVTAVTASAAAVDDTAVVPRLLEQHEQRCGSPKRAVADRLYGSQDCLGYLQERDIETVIRQRQGGNAHGGFDKSEFVYDADQDVYCCPAGQTLRRRRTQKKNNKAFYSADREVCQSCPLQNECVSAKSTTGVRQITRFDTPYVARAEAACATVQGRRLLQKRQTCIEGLFGRAKSQHGLRRARWRGLSKMYLQSLLTAMVLNVKQLLQAVFGRKVAVCKRVAVLGDFLFYKKIHSLILQISIFFCNRKQNVILQQIPY